MKNINSFNDNKRLVNIKIYPKLIFPFLKIVQVFKIQKR